MRFVVAWMIPAIGAATNASVAGAQGWNDSTVRALIDRAIARRANQLDSMGLADYHARAHGYLTFLAQVGPGFPDVPRIVRSDELAVEVYWRAPDLSKEVVVGRRDTLLLPVDVGYYSDRFGIIQGGLRDSIRLGEGNDVRGVPHPLAPGAPALYDYAIADSLRIRTPQATNDVLVVRVRPRDPSAPRVVGTLYLDRASGALVRLSFTFTRSAILDRRIERLSVTLENAQEDGRFWLPRTQELEVVRTTTWLNYPVRGIIRARWHVCCYAINRGLDPRMFAGAEIVAAPQVVLGAYHWQGHVLDSIPPDVRAPTPADVQEAEATARSLMRQSALAHVQGSVLSARGISDFVRIDRVEGLGLGAGLTHAIASGWSADARARYGISDRAVKGELTLSWQQPAGLGLRATAFRRYAEAGDFPESSTLANTLAAELAGADRTDPYDVRGVEIAAMGPAPAGLRWQATVARESQGPLVIHADPAFGRYGPTIPAWALWDTRGAVGLDRPEAVGPFGAMWQTHARLDAIWLHRRGAALAEREPLVGRAFWSAEAVRPIGADRLDARLTAAMVVARGGLAATPPQDFVFLGGPLSGPGYGFHELAAQTGASAHLEWGFPIPFPAIDLGRRFGGASARSAIVAPFVHTDYVDRSAPFALRREGWYPALGVGLISFFDLLRVDVARGLRDGRWTLSVDTDRAWWAIL
jgi:hypothetical protein